MRDFTITVTIEITDDKNSPVKTMLSTEDDRICDAMLGAIATRIHYGIAPIFEKNFSAANDDDLPPNVA